MEIPVACGITLRNLLSTVEITTWNEAFKTFSLLPEKSRTDISFLIASGKGWVRRYTVSIPREAVNNPAHLPTIVRYLAFFLYNRLVIDGGGSVYVRSEPPDQESVIAHLVGELFEKQLPRARFYGNFGDPICILPAGDLEYAVVASAPKICAPRGMPSTASDFQPSRGSALGLDIGGTNIKVAILKNGRCLDERRVPVDKGGGQALADQVEALVGGSLQRLIQTDEGQLILDAIGLGLAGVLKGQRIIRMTNFERHWAEARKLGSRLIESGPSLFPDDYAVLNDLPRRLRAKFGVEFAPLINDADAFGFWELICRHSGHPRTVVVMTLGTGVGYVKIDDSAIYDLPHQGGHLIVALGGKPDSLPVDLGCGHSGCLAAYVSATALNQGLQEATRGSRTSPELINKVLTLVKDISNWLAVAVAELGEITPELDEVMLAAGVMCGETGELILRFTQEALRSRFPEVARRVRVARIGTATEWGGAMGAAQYANYYAQLSRSAEESSRPDRPPQPDQEPVG
jgi:predicted NBD/HSP70 family sugar kinase